MGIIMCENIINHLKEAKEGENRSRWFIAPRVKWGGAILTAISTTIVSFLAVFTMTGAEGKLFKTLSLYENICFIGVSPCCPFCNSFFGTGVLCAEKENNLEH
jgi:Cu(I)/Ag(I) efflux system membrane protein CusA/SilA